MHQRQTINAEKVKILKVKTRNMLIKVINKKLRELWELETELYYFNISFRKTQSSLADIEQIFHEKGRKKRLKTDNKKKKEKEKE